MHSSDCPIGVMDSGIGGLTVFRSILKVLPQENLIYLADSQRIPYGDKDRSALVQYALEASQFLKEKKIKALVIACHTLSAQTLDILENTLQIPVIGAIQAGIKMLGELSEMSKLAILGTQSTIHSGVYQFLIRSILPQLEIYPVACPLLVPKIEEAFENREEMEQVVKQYIRPLKEAKVDAVLLGCTHYPLLRSLFEKLLGKKVFLVDPSDVIALDLKEVLEKRMLLNLSQSPKHDFFVTSNPEKFASKAKLFLKMDVAPSLVEIAH